MNGADVAGGPPLPAQLDPVSITIIGAVALVAVVAVVGLAIWWIWFRDADDGPAVQIARFARNPRVICASSACSVGLAWRVEGLGEGQEVTLRLRSPDGETVALSDSPIREDPELRVGADDPDLFSTAGTYAFELSVTDGSGATLAAETREVTSTPVRRSTSRTTGTPG